MSKKRVQFDLDEAEGEQQLPTDELQSKNPFNKKFKHTLDSDEEDDELEDAKKYEFGPEEYDGEEEGNLHKEGEITITPFNIKDELKEGHFDDQGTFIFNKEKEEIRDNWIDNIDWQAIKEEEGSEKPSKRVKLPRPGRSRDEGDDSDESSEDERRSDDEKADSISCLKGLIELMNPEETVQRAMQRLGKSKLKNARNTNKYRQKSASKSAIDKSVADKPVELSKEEQEDQERKERLNSLIELSNKLLNDGDMNIYEKKREALQYQLDAELKQAKSEQESDMFAD